VLAIEATIPPTSARANILQESRAEVLALLLDRKHLPLDVLQTARQRLSGLVGPGVDLSAFSKFVIAYADEHDALEALAREDIERVAASHPAAKTRDLASDLLRYLIEGEAEQPQSPPPQDPPAGTPPAVPPAPLTPATPPAPPAEEETLTADQLDAEVAKAAGVDAEKLKKILEKTAAEIVKEIPSLDDRALLEALLGDTRKTVAKAAGDRLAALPPATPPAPPAPPADTAPQA
jgi:hypothetical protein